MDKLIKNAKNQFLKYNQVTITVYPNRCYNDSYNIIEKTLVSAIETISHFYESINDDIYVSN